LLPAPNPNIRHFGKAHIIGALTIETGGFSVGVPSDTFRHFNSFLVVQRLLNALL